MMTEPGIYEAQNTRDNQRHVAAQARTYSDAKLVLAYRVGLVFMLACATAVCAVAFPDERTVIGTVGGLVVLLLSGAASSLEKTLRFRAASIQEQFDNDIFQLRWNPHQADRPNLHRVNRAANKYRGSRDKNWYDPTYGTHRPYDVLICQSSNLGWGATMHYIWAWMLVAMLALLVGVIGLLYPVLGLELPQFLIAVAFPFVGPAKEVYDQIAANFDTHRSKDAAERRISDLWRDGMDGRKAPTEQDLRDIQDKILQFRQANPFVPDWIDNLFHSRNEAAMRSSVEARVDEARRCGHSDQPVT